MTDPERISHRSTGLAAELLRAGATEQPRSAGVERTLAALGVSAAVVTTAGTTAAAVATTTGTKAVKAVSGLLLVKWIGVGVVGGVGLAGAAAVVSAPAAPRAPAPLAASSPRAPTPRAAAPVAPAAPLSVESPAPEVSEPAEVADPSPAARPAVAPAQPDLDVGAPLAAEVAFIDRARAALAAGRAEQGLSQLAAYEREFPEARLLPEVLFLRLETCARLGRQAEARAAAQRLVEGFPRSPHAARARQVLEK